MLYKYIKSQNIFAFTLWKTLYLPMEKINFVYSPYSGAFRDRKGLDILISENERAKGGTTNSGGSRCASGEQVETLAKRYINDFGYSISRLKKEIVKGWEMAETEKQKALKYINGLSKKRG